MAWRKQRNGKWTRQYYRQAGPITLVDHRLYEMFTETILSNLFRESPLLCRIGKAMPVFHGGSVL